MLHVFGTGTCYHFNHLNSPSVLNHKINLVIDFVPQNDPAVYAYNCNVKVTAY